MRAFTLAELLIILFVIALLVGMMGAVIAEAKREARQVARQAWYRGRMDKAYLDNLNSTRWKIRTYERMR